MLALRGDPPGRPERRMGQAPGGRRLRRRARRRCCAAHGDFCVGVAAFPYQHPRSASLEDGHRSLRGEVPRRRGLRDHADVLRRRRLPAPARPGRGRRLRRPDHRRDSCRSPTWASSSAPSSSPVRRSRLGSPLASTPSPTTRRRCGRWASTRRRSSPSGCCDEGVPGIHFYTLNRSKATREVWANLALGVPRLRPMPTRPAAWSALHHGHRPGAGAAAVAAGCARCGSLARPLARRGVPPTAVTVRRRAACGRLGAACRGQCPGSRCCSCWPRRSAMRSTARSRCWPSRASALRRRRGQGGRPGRRHRLRRSCSGGAARRCGSRSPLPAAVAACSRLCARSAALSCAPGITVARATDPRDLHGARRARCARCRRRRWPVTVCAAVWVALGRRSPWSSSRARRLRRGARRSAVAAVDPSSAARRAGAGRASAP